eukprot:3522999-Rhodomonas_salina.1
MACHDHEGNLFWVVHVFRVSDFGREALKLKLGIPTPGTRRRHYPGTRGTPGISARGPGVTYAGTRVSPRIRVLSTAGMSAPCAET